MQRKASFLFFTFLLLLSLWGCRSSDKAPPDPAPTQEAGLKSSGMFVRKSMDIKIPEEINMPEGVSNDNSNKLYFYDDSNGKKISEMEIAPLCSRKSDWGWWLQYGWRDPLCKDIPPYFYMSDMNELDLFNTYYHLLYFRRPAAKEGSIGMSVMPRPGQIANAYFPTQVMSINQNSSNVEEAKDFIRFVLTDEEAQTGQTTFMGLNDGLPVQREFIKKMFAQRLSEFRMGDDGGQVKSVDRIEEHTDLLLSMCDKLSRPVLTDKALRSIVLEESMPYFNGEVSLEAAVENAAQAANLYLRE